MIIELTEQQIAHLIELCEGALENLYIRHVGNGEEDVDYALAPLERFASDMGEDEILMNQELIRRLRGH